MANFKNVIYLALITLLTACGSPVNIEGDVFLVKGDGKPQPAAAKEVVFLPINEDGSLEQLLTDIYLDAIKEEVEKNELAIKDLCTKSTNIIKNSLDKQNDSLGKIINLAKSDGTTDNDGTCLIINSKSKDSLSASEDKQNYYKDLISAEREKITNAQELIGTLKSSRWSKIKNKEKELYEEFMTNIRISFTDGNVIILKVVNDTPHNIRIDGHLKVQFYNYLNKPIGHHKRISDYGARYGDCNNWSGASYKKSGFAIKANLINKGRGNDSFGFTKTSHLEKGESAEDANNFLCEDSFSPSERLELTKKYDSDEKSWPDKNVIDKLKPYKIISGKFIPLEDETRKEVNGSIVYTSKEINFLTVASNLNWPETTIIKIQDEIIKNTKIEIAKLEMAKQDDPLISTALTNQNTSKRCENHQNIVSSEKESLLLLDQNLDISQACDLDNGDLVSSLTLEEKADVQLKDQVLNLDYANIASAEALNMISNAKHRVSTNISGHYQINELPRGEYLIISNYSDNFIEGIFLANTSIDADGIFDLSNTNYFSIPSFGYLVSKFYENCSENTCTREDFKNSLNLQNIADEYESYKAQIEETSAEMRRLCRSLGLASCS